MARWKLMRKACNDEMGRARWKNISAGRSDWHSGGVDAQWNSSMIEAELSRGAMQR